MAVQEIEEGNEEGLEALEEETTEETPVEEVIPDKFKGKSPQDIAKAYEELEKRLGEQSNELGDLRKMAREFITKDLHNTKKQVDEEPVKITEDDLRDNPLTAISKLIDNKLSEVRKSISKVDVNTARMEFETKHPDFRQVANSKEFQDWVGSSPYRIQMFARADNMDFMAADELISNYKDFNKTRESVSQDISNGLKKGSKETMRKMKGESGTSGATTKKVYRSYDLVRMKATDPERYEAMQEEIMEAYREGRVK